MAYQVDFKIKLKGNVELLKKMEDIIRASLDGTYDEMDSFLEQYNITDIDSAYADATPYHLSLLAFIACDKKHAKEVADEAWRDFIDGVDLEDDTLVLYTRMGSQDGCPEFFDKLTKYSNSKITSFELECLEDDEDEEDYEDEYFDLF